MTPRAVDTSPVLGVSVLDGLTIIRWIGVEMALTWGDENDPDGDLTPIAWRHASIPFAQFTCLWVESDCGERFRLVSQLGEPPDIYGFCVQRDCEPPALAARSRQSIYCTRVIDELPKGRARLVHRRVEDAQSTIEFCLQVDASTVRLLAAEVYGRAGGLLEIVEADESILVQVNGVAP